MSGPLHLLWILPCGVIGIRILLGIIRLLWWQAPSPALARRIADTVLAARRAGHDAGDALVAMTWQADMPRCWRLARAGRALSSGTAACLAEALAAERLLPSDVALVGAAAHRLGPAAEERWLAELAAEQGETQLVPVISHAMATMAVVMAVITFVATFILPKWEAIMRDLNARLDAPTWLYDRQIQASALGLLLGLGVAVAWAWWWWRWRSIRRAATGGLLAAATAAGVPERDIAAALAPRMAARCRGRLEAAGSAGDWQGICSAVGWPVRDHDALVRALAAFARRRAWTAGMVSAAARILVPLVMAVPVYLVAELIFGSLVRILHALGGV